MLEVREMTLQDFKERLDGNLDLATRIQELCWGIDDSEVKNSLDRPASIGLEDRFLPITSGSEARDKMQWLLNRLCLLIHEDGRLPQVCKG